MYAVKSNGELMVPKASIRFIHICRQVRWETSPQSGILYHRVRGKSLSLMVAPSDAIISIKQGHKECLARSRVVWNGCLNTTASTSPVTILTVTLSSVLATQEPSLTIKVKIWGQCLYFSCKCRCI